FDYLLTLDLEIKYVWKSRWSIIKFLYLVMRYMPFLSVIVISFVDGEIFSFL
ncbi:hypothetical protein AMATHDRAFT_150896, partial [Amanita thiersii Skay4041]